jgi:hypothetical protein
MNTMTDHPEAKKIPIAGLMTVVACLIVTVAPILLAYMFLYRK